MLELPRHSATRAFFTVDSGATRSCISLAFAIDILGIDEGDLIEVIGGVELADGSVVAAWTTPEPIPGRVLTGAGEPTDATFELDPLIIETGDSLLGQQDIFHPFELTFRTVETDQVLELRY